MNAFLRLVLALGLLTVAARGTERRIERTFPAAVGGTLTIDTYRGAITVTEADTKEVQIAVTLNVAPESAVDVERILSRLKLDISDEAGHVRVVARHPHETKARFVWNDDDQIEPAFQVTVPAAFNLDLKTINGSVIVGNVTGRLRVALETGNIFVRRVGGDVDLATQFGDVIVSRCTGPLKARVLRGLIRVGTVTGATDLRNTSGDVEVMAAKADLQVYAEAGNAIVGFPRDFQGRAEVRSSGGSIGAKIDPAANCDLEAKAAWLGKVKTKVAFKTAPGGVGERKLAGRLNAGGPRIVLRASGGSVLIEPGESPFEDDVTVGR
ncbi:hypothetical protein [Opitutus sp. ER46]|uniref:hypothetical protein n=1 Tax=Opitutus sp. ER46 TaxID=2161864 RepID=UPI000D30F031|nr:hypothetical protein [Opitutus sp. ER46]PTX95796.1 hypothetical protein DB354_10325 [Opitutus sp. ER46]